MFLLFCLYNVHKFGQSLSISPVSFSLCPLKFHLKRLAIMKVSHGLASDVKRTLNYTSHRMDQSTRLDAQMERNVTLDQKKLKPPRWWNQGPSHGNKIWWVKGGLEERLKFVNEFYLNWQKRKNGESADKVIITAWFYSKVLLALKTYVLTRFYSMSLCDLKSLMYYRSSITIDNEKSLSRVIGYRWIKDSC